MSDFAYGLVTGYRVAWHLPDGGCGRNGNHGAEFWGDSRRATGAGVHRRRPTRGSGGAAVREVTDAVLPVVDTLAGIPFFLPVVIAAILLAAVNSAWIGRLLQAPAWSIFAIACSLGLVVATTLTPSAPALAGLDPSAWFSQPGRWCFRDDGFAPPSLWRLGFINETSLNVALFVPLGASCLTLRRWEHVVIAALLGVCVPIGVELTQYAVPTLGRICTTADISANLTGLGVGLALGALFVRPLIMALVAVKSRS